MDSTTYHKTMALLAESYENMCKPSQWILSEEAAKRLCEMASQVSTKATIIYYESSDPTEGIY